MTNAKKLLITTQSHESFVLRAGSRKRAFGHCRLCGNQVEMLSLDQAVWESGLRTNVLVQAAESNAIHTIETQSGHLIVCAASIAKFKTGSSMEKGK